MEGGRSGGQVSQSDDKTNMRGESETFDVLEDPLISMTQWMLSCFLTRPKSLNKKFWKKSKERQLTCLI